MRRGWGAEKRLEFIDFRLFWGGVINRSDLVDEFGVSIPQASNDLSLYREHAPNNIRYDASAKRYFATDRYEPCFYEPNPDRYLAQLMAISDGTIAIDDTWISDLSGVTALPVPRHRIDPNILRDLLGVIRSYSSVQIIYQSMSSSSPDPTERWITPHALGNDGFRWHVRAFCHASSIFKDFVLGRCLKVGARGAPAADGASDWQWNEYFKISLAPNPSLSLGQKRAVALDYGMANERIVVPVRFAMLYYFTRHLKLEVEESNSDPRRRPLIVENRQEYNEVLERINSVALLSN